MRTAREMSARGEEMFVSSGVLTATSLWVEGSWLGPAVTRSKYLSAIEEG